MSKKLLTIIMMLCMVMGTGTLAYADVIPDYTGIDETETLIGEEETLEQGGSLNEEAQMSVVSANNENFVSVINSASTGDIIQVTGDITLEQAVTISGKSVTIKSNGGPWTITRGSTATGNLITVESGAALTIENIIIDGNKDVVTDAGGSLVCVEGNFTMNGGEISGNTTSGYGGGVKVNNGGAFTMNEGKISGNNPTSGGGGVAVGPGGNFTMNGGEISDNTQSSGGVYVNGAFTMSGGTISGNTANSRGGGVYVSGTGEFTMSGGEISGNTANDSASGVYVGAKTTFNLSGAAKITGNTQTNGTENNVFLLENKTIILTDALSDGAAIGVTTEATPDTNTPVTIATAGTDYSGGISTSDLAKFSSDSTAYVTRLKDGNIELCLSAKIPTPAEKLVYNGETQTALATPADTAGYTFTGDSKLSGKKAGSYTASRRSRTSSAR